MTKRVIPFLIVISMLISSMPVFAISGSGTEANPYLISSASDIAKMHNDLNGYYKLTANIDMSGIEFEPIGNESEGAFTGTIDGNGYTISNLNINLPDNKYVGFVGYLEGTVKNLNITNVDAYGYRYVGGLVGYAEENSTISNCTVSGTVSGKYKIININIGGIVGYNSSGTVSNCANNGSIIVSDSHYDNDEYHIGGIAGSGGTVRNCANSGSIIVSDSHYDDDEYYIGGIAGNGGTVRNCTNSGKIRFSGEFRKNYVAGIVGSTGYRSSTISCINSGSVDVSGFGLQHNYGGIVGADHYYITNDCYQLKNVAFDPTDYGSNGTVLFLDEFRSPACFGRLNFTDVWFIDPETNSGFPQLQNMPRHIDLNESIAIICPGETKQLYAYIAGASENVTWSCDDTTVAAVSENGKITALSKGTATVTATNAEGMKANCLVYVYGKADSLALSSNDVTIAAGSTKTLTYSQAPDDANEVVIWSSDNKAVATVSNTGVVTAKKRGTANITGTTEFGNISDTCKVTVVGTAITGVSLPATSATVNVGSAKELTATVTPTEYAGTLTWSSSNEAVATVENGTVMAISPGTAVISVESDTGKTAQCTVTVKAPATSIKLNKNEITLEIGYTEKLTTSVLPINTTDTISWSSSSTTYVSVASDGTVTAKKAGTATITATTTSGKEAYCVVKVVNPTVPVASVTLDKTEHIMTQSETVQLKSTVFPTDATNKNLTWTTSDESVATVSNTGVVTANSVGTAVIKATTNNGMYHECIIKVVSASGPSIVLMPENAIPNAISKVKANIIRNPGMSGYKFTINYDDTLLTPVSVTANEEFGGTLTTNLDDENRTEFNVVWYSNGDTDIDINGELFTIDFKVAETAKLGDYSDISIEYGAKDICNTAGENIALYTESAKVTVEEPLAGDIYEDGDVNIYDLTLLARHMIGLADFTDRQMEAANVTDDDLVDIKDVVKLAQYVVGWTGVELMSLMSLDADVPETPIVTVGTASVNDANEADIPVYIKNNTGIAAYRFVLDYNADDIEIVSITPSDFINSENFGTNLGQENDEGLIVFCYQEGNAVTDGQLFTIKVRYKNPTDTSVSPIIIKSAENNICNQAIENVAASYEMGYTLGDDYIAVNKNVGETGFACELYFDASYEEQPATVIIAFYDGDGRLVQLKSANITAKPGRVDVSIGCDKVDYATYKLMIWKSLGSARPLTEVK